MGTCLTVLHVQVLDCGYVRSLLANTKTLRQILEEAMSLLRMFWRAALPSTDPSVQNLKKVQDAHFFFALLSWKITPYIILNIHEEKCGRIFQNLRLVIVFPFMKTERSKIQGK